MIYQTTSAKVIIARLETNYDIDYSDWIHNSPLWISDALDELDMLPALEDVKVDLEVEDYHVKLPDGISSIKQIDCILYNDFALININKVNPASHNTTLHNPNSLDVRNYSENYTIKNGFIHTSFQTGIITVFYKRVPFEYDEVKQVYFPQVPDDSIVQNAIAWYVMYAILRKGHKITGYDLNSNNPIINPFLMWEREKKS